MGLGDRWWAADKGEDTRKEGTGEVGKNCGWDWLLSFPLVPPPYCQGTVSIGGGPFYCCDLAAPCGPAPHFLGPHGFSSARGHKLWHFGQNWNLQLEVVDRDGKIDKVPQMTFFRRPISAPGNESRKRALQAI